MPSRGMRRGGRGAHPDEVPLFGPFAVTLGASREEQVATMTAAHDNWALRHLLPFFADWAIDEAMPERHGERDLEALPSGPPRRQPRVGKVRARLAQRGRLVVSGRGPGYEWELTELGWVKVRREKKIEPVRQERV